MGVIEGTTEVKTAVGEYDFAVDGGAAGAITLRSAAGDIIGNALPAGSVVLSGYIEVDTALTSGGSATVSVGIEGAADLLAATAFGSAPWSSTGRKSVTPAGTGATSVKTTVTRSLAVTVAVAALTGGKFRVVVLYR